MIVPARSDDDRQTLLAFLSNRLQTTKDDLVGAYPFEVVGAIVRGQLAGAVLYHQYRGNVIEMTQAGHPGWLTRPHLRTLFQYPFCQLGVRTVTGVVSASNTRVRDLNKRLGFVECGVIPEWDGPGLDAVLCAMTKNQCRWIDG